jgi:hypothetical protein
MPLKADGDERREHCKAVKSGWQGAAGTNKRIEVKVYEIKCTTANIKEYR